MSSKSIASYFVKPKENRPMESLDSSSRREQLSNSLVESSLTQCESHTNQLHDTVVQQHSTADSPGPVYQPDQGEHDACNGIEDLREIQGYDNDGNDNNDNEYDQGDDIDDLPRRCRKRPVAPSFDYEPIQIKRTRKVGNVTLTSVEDTECPILSLRARIRSVRKLETSGKEVRRQDTKLEIAMRVREDKMNTLEMKPVDGIIRLWCRACLTAINANKSHTLKHLNSRKHKQKIEVKGKKLLEDQVLGNALTNWRRLNPDVEGRTIDELTDRFRMETVRSFMLSGIPISKVSFI